LVNQESEPVLSTRIDAKLETPRVRERRYRSDPRSLTMEAVLPHRLTRKQAADNRHLHHMIIRAMPLLEFANTTLAPAGAVRLGNAPVTGSTIEG
jgi:hypothetical protein